MSGGARFAECVAAHLGYPCLAREVVAASALKLGVCEETLRRKIQESPGVWSRLTDERRTYLLALQSALADACVTGNLVYHGHAGHLLLKGLPNVLRVRLIAPLEMRVRALMEREGIDARKAHKRIREQDRDRIQWTKFLYGLDWRDPANYDVVINLESVRLATGCMMIASAVHLPDYTNTAEKVKRLRDFALECRVKVALAKAAPTRDVNFDVRANGGQVEVFGEVKTSGVLGGPSEPSAEEVREIVAQVSGVTRAEVTMKMVPKYTDL
jgi:cytidylate kinase